VRSYERATSVTAAINNMFTRLLDGTRAMLWGEDYRCYAERVNVYRSEVTVNRLSQDVAQDVCLAVLTALDRYQLSRACRSQRSFVALAARERVVDELCRHKVMKSFRSAVRDRSCQWCGELSNPNGWAGCWPYCLIGSARLWCSVEIGLSAAENAEVVQSVSVRY